MIDTSERKQKDLAEIQMLQTKKDGFDRRN